MATNRFKYKFFSVITQLSVTVTVILYLKTYYTYLIERKEGNSSNSITFPASVSKSYTALMPEGYNVLMPNPETD